MSRKENEQRRRDRNSMLCLQESRGPSLVNLSKKIVAYLQQDLIGELRSNQTVLETSGAAETSFCRQ